MISKKKKIIILAGMVVLLAVTGILNVYLNANADNKPANTDGIVYSDFFLTYKADRQATRDLTILQLDSIIDNPASTQEALSEAQSQKLDITKHMAVENTLESQIKSLGYNDVAITSSASKVTIIIRTEDLSEIEVAQILQLTLTETKRTASDVRIIPVD